MEDKLVLVSVVVATYNSSATIIDTLESIKYQTYKKIELIISDDYSQDNTTLLCEDWISANRSLFVDTKIIKSLVNTGVAANFNRGIKSSNGVWIKTIAGDDLLIKNAIQIFIEESSKYDFPFYVSELELFGGNQAKNKKYQSIINAKLKKIALLNREKQYRKALVEGFAPGPGWFYKKEIWQKLKAFNENYPFTEEYDFELKLLKLYPIKLVDKKLVKWRQRDDSLSNDKNSLSYKEDSRYYWEERRNIIKKNKMYMHLLDLDLLYKYNDTGKFFYKVIRFLSPVYLKHILHKLVNFL